MTKILYWLNLVSMICSLTGYSVLALFRLFFSKAMYNKALAIKPYLITATGIFVVTLLFTWAPWGKFHYGDQPKQIVYFDSSKLRSKPIQILSQDKHPAAKHMNRYPKKIRYTIPHDTTKQTTKYDLSHATVTQSAVGDHASVKNFGKPQRHYLTCSAMILNTLQLEKTDSVIIDFDMNNSEEKILAVETFEALKSLSYKTGWISIVYGGIPPQSTQGDYFTKYYDKSGTLHLVVMAE